MTDADFVLAVAGAPFTDITVPSGAVRPDSLHTSPPAAAAALGRAGVDALSLATDESFDTGPDGLADTIGHADAAGIATIGAGADLVQAEQPLLLRTELGAVAVVAFTENSGHRAGPDTPGPMVLSPEAVRRGSDLARAAGADWVIAAPHWGDSYAPVQPRQRYWAQLFADAGYDLVVGSGPHIAQQIDHIGEVPVIYSVGNFVYGTASRYASSRSPRLRPVRGCRAQAGTGRPWSASAASSPTTGRSASSLDPANRSRRRRSCPRWTRSWTCRATSASWTARVSPRWANSDGRLGVCLVIVTLLTACSSGQVTDRTARSSPHSAACSSSTPTRRCTPGRSGCGTTRPPTRRPRRS